MSYDDSWENNIYAQHKQVNRYPYGELVSTFFNALQFLDMNKENKSEIKVLELGSGAGNNLWFFAENGFDTYGVDGSQSACKLAEKLCFSKNQKVNIQQAYFDSLPFEDESVDIIIDRCATYCGTYENIKEWWKEANRVLKKGGLVISFRFTDTHPNFLKLKKNEISALKIADRTYTDVKKGPFKDTGIVHFSTYKELFELFNFCDIKSIHKHRSETVYDTVNNEYSYSEWIMVGVKK